MWAYKNEDPVTVHHFLGMTYDKLWRVLFKLQEEGWPTEEEEDIGLDPEHPPKKGWVEKAKKINSSAPLPEDPRSAELEEMLAVAPYMAPEKEKKKKNPKREAREGLRPRVLLDTKSGDTHAPSTHEGEQEEEEEEEESDSSRTKKRAASAEAEGNHPSLAPKKRSRGKLVLPDDSSDSDESAASEKVPEKASALAAAANATELAELNRKLKSSDQELDLVNKRFDEAQAAVAEVESLKAELLQAKKEAAEQKAAAEQAAAELTLVKTEHENHEARVAEVQQELKDAITKCEELEQKNKYHAIELANMKTKIPRRRGRRRDASGRSSDK
nr:uncharacterized protein DDB_G0286299-like [Aegilops tauschii subsp. strangulata]